jgi:predicted ATPase
MALLHDLAQAGSQVIVATHSGHDDDLHQR